MRSRLLLPLVLMALAGCAAHDTQVNAFKIGSATSKNVFVDPS
ncbi:TraT complement resistance family protein, partial [Myxococcus llanfairpwllgwyngyllgogerychwyrndrobwllllantysiliogogogochensis]